jgi:hypothetical protein
LSYLFYYLVQIDYTLPENVSKNVPPILEHFLDKIKRCWLESTSYTRTCWKFNIAVSDIPPVIAPSMRGACTFNTELQKNSTFLRENSTFLRENGNTKGGSLKAL